VILITSDGSTLTASPWFRRLKVGDSIALALSPRTVPRPFRRLEWQGKGLLVEHGTGELALRRALDVSA